MPGGFARTPYTYDCSYVSFGNVQTHEPDGIEFSYDWGTSLDGPYASTPGASIGFPGGITDPYDVAHQICGEGWQIPTGAMVSELFENCDFIDSSGNIIPNEQEDKRTYMRGIRGIRLRSKLNGSELFFACCGRAQAKVLEGKGTLIHFWERELSSVETASAITISSAGVIITGSMYRYRGLPVIPVYVE